MRTNIEIDDKLMRQAMRATGAKTKKATVQEALETVIRMRNQVRAFDNLFGKVEWEGDLRWARSKDKWEEPTASPERGAASRSSRTTKRAAA